MSGAAQVNGPSGSGKFIDGIDPEDPQYIKNLQRPAEVKEDLHQMENRSRVKVVLNSESFKEELEEIVDEQLRNGPYPASLLALQQINELLAPASKGGLGRGSTVIPINDLKTSDQANFKKGEKLLRCKLAALYRLVDLHGWSEGIYNHISARVSADEEHFLLNPFGMLYSEVTAASLIKVDVNGDVVDPGTCHLGVSKAGFTLHSAIHQARPDIKCIVHLHTPAGSAVSSMKCGLLPLCQEAMLVGNISYHDYQGILIDQEEREKLGRSLGVHNKILVLRNHGLIACGESVEEAFHYAWLLMAACEAQIRAIPVGIDNLVLPSDEARQQAFKIGNQGGGGVETTGKKWKVGELEFEAWMRSMDNSGYRTGYLYRMPMIKQDKKDRTNSEVEIPPSSSSFTYVFDGDYENSKYVSPLKMAQDRQKKAFKAGWLTSPNAYKKTEVEEIGTTTPKKITKWVSDGENPNKPGCVQVKLEHPNQFAPQGENPKEFKQKQKSIKKDYYEEKVSAGPQSKILEGISWDEAQKAKDGKLSGAGDQVIVVGAASKGIIQRDHQHNAVVYRQYYAANPFENMSEAEIENYQGEVQKKEGQDEEPPVQVPQEVEVVEDSNKTQEAQESEELMPDRYINAISEDSVDPMEFDNRGQDAFLARLADTVVQTVMHDALAVVRRRGGKGQQILTGRSTDTAHLRTLSLYSGGQMGVCSNLESCQGNKSSHDISMVNREELSDDKDYVQVDTLRSWNNKEPFQHKGGGSWTKEAHNQKTPNAAYTAGSSSYTSKTASAASQFVTLQINPVTVRHRAHTDKMRIKFSIHSTVRRRICAEIDGVGPIEEVHAYATQPTVHTCQSDLGEYGRESFDGDRAGCTQDRSEPDISQTAREEEPFVKANQDLGTLFPSHHTGPENEGESNEENIGYEEIEDQGGTQWKFKEKDIALSIKFDTRDRSRKEGAEINELVKDHDKETMPLPFPVIKESDKLNDRNKNPETSHPWVKESERTISLSSPVVKEIDELHDKNENYETPHTLAKESERAMSLPSPVVKESEKLHEKYKGNEAPSPLVKDFVGTKSLPTPVVKGSDKLHDISKDNGRPPLVKESQGTKSPPRPKSLPKEDKRKSSQFTKNKAKVPSMLSPVREIACEGTEEEMDEMEAILEAADDSFEQLLITAEDTLLLCSDDGGQGLDLKDFDGIVPITERPKMSNVKCLKINECVNDEKKQNQASPTCTNALSEMFSKTVSTVHETTCLETPQKTVQAEPVKMYKMLHNDVAKDPILYEDNMPYHEDNMLYHEDNMPYHEDNMPYHVDNMPYHEDNMSYHEDDVPFIEDNVPFIEDNVPFMEYTAPCATMPQNAYNSSIRNPAVAHHVEHLEDTVAISQNRGETNVDNIPFSKTETNVDDIPFSKTEINVDDIPFSKTETNVDDIPFSKTETNINDIPFFKTEINVDDIPFSKTETNIDDIPFSKTETDVNNIPFSKTETNVDDIPFSKTETNVDDIPFSKTETNINDIPFCKTETNVDDIPFSKTETNVDDIPFSKTEINVDDIPFSKTETNIDDIPFSKTETNVNNIPFSKTETNVNNIPFSKTETNVDDIPFSKTETNVDNIPFSKTETNIDDIPFSKTETIVNNIPFSKTETNVDDIPFSKTETNVDNIILDDEIEDNIENYQYEQPDFKGILCQTPEVIVDHCEIKEDANLEYVSLTDNEKDTSFLFDSNSKDGPLQTSSPKIGRVKYKPNQGRDFNEVLCQSENHLLDSVCNSHMTSRSEVKSQPHLMDTTTGSSSKTDSFLVRSSSLDRGHLKDTCVINRLRDGERPTGFHSSRSVLDEYHLKKHNELMELPSAKSFLTQPFRRSSFNDSSDSDVMPPLLDTEDVPSISDIEDSDLPVMTHHKHFIKHPSRLRDVDKIAPVNVTKSSEKSPKARWVPKSKRNKYPVDTNNSPIGIASGQSKLNRTGPNKADSNNNSRNNQDDWRYKDGGGSKSNSKDVEGNREINVSQRNMSGGGGRNKDGKFYREVTNKENTNTNPDDQGEREDKGRKWRPTSEGEIDNRRRNESEDRRGSQDRDGKKRNEYDKDGEKERETKRRGSEDRYRKKRNDYGKDINREKERESKRRGSEDRDRRKRNDYDKDINAEKERESRRGSEDRDIKKRNDYDQDINGEKERESKRRGSEDRDRKKRNDYDLDINAEKERESRRCSEDRDRKKRNDKDTEKERESRRGSEDRDRKKRNEYDDDIEGERVKENKRRGSKERDGRQDYGDKKRRDRGMDKRDMGKDKRHGEWERENRRRGLEDGGKQEDREGVRRDRKIDGEHRRDSENKEKPEDRKHRDGNNRRVGRALDQWTSPDDGVRKETDMDGTQSSLKPVNDKMRLTSNPGLNASRDFDLAASQRLSRRRGGAIAPPDEDKWRRQNSPYKLMNNHLTVPLGDGHRLNKSYGSMNKSCTSLASSTLSRRSKSSSRIFENRPDLLPPKQQLNPLTGEPYNFFHPLMHNSIESLLSRASSGYLYHSQTDLYNHRFEPLNAPVVEGAKSLQLDERKENKNGNLNDKGINDKRREKSPDRADDRLGRYHGDKRKEPENTRPREWSTDLNESNDKYKTDTIDSYKGKPKTDTKNLYNDNPKTDTKDTYKDKPKTDTKNLYNNNSKTDTKDTYKDKPKTDTKDLYKDKPKTDTKKSKPTTDTMELNNDQSIPSIIDEEMVQRSVNVEENVGMQLPPKVPDIEDEAEDLALPPKKNLLSKLSCVGGRSSAIAKKKDQGEGKLPLETRATVDDSGNQKEYFAAEKKRMKKLAKEKSVQEADGFYFQQESDESDSENLSGKTKPKESKECKGGKKEDEETAKPFSTFAAPSSTNEGYGDYFEEPKRRSPERSARDKGGEFDSRKDTRYKPEERKKNRDETEDKSPDSDKKWQPRARRDQQSSLRPRPSKSPENPNPPRLRKFSSNEPSKLPDAILSETINSTLDSEMGAIKTSSPLHYSMGSSHSPHNVTNTSFNQCDPSVSFDTSELTRYKKHGRMESFDANNSFPANGSPPLRQSGISPVRRRMSQVSLGMDSSSLSRPRSSSISSNPLTYQPWRSKNKQRSRSMSISEMVYAAGVPRPKQRSHSVGEITYNSLLGNMGRRRSRTNSIGEMVVTPRMYHRRRSRSHSRASLGDTSFGSIAPGLQRRPSGTVSSPHPTELDVTPSTAPVPVRRVQSTKEPMIEELDRKNMERSKSERQPQIKEELGEDKPVSPSKSDTMKSTDSASGGETLEERSSKEGSPTKEHPSAKDKKGKKKKFRIPSFSKKKNKEAKESAI